MQRSVNAGILGVGMAVPERVMTNADLEKIVDTTDEWIRTRTGIRERRISSPDETSSTLGAEASRRALAHAGVPAEELDMIICATATGDYIWPATACLIQQAIGAKRATAYDITAACSGFVYGLATASAYIQSGQARRVLVVGAETLSKMVNWEDRATCVLFGDGAGAAVLGPCAPDEGVLSSAMGSDGGGFEMIILPAGGTKIPITPEVLEQKLNRIFMRGSEVYKFAVKIMGDVCLDALCKANLTPADVSLFIPHQANTRIIEAAASRMGLPPEKVFINLDRYGNTSAASIPIGLTEAVTEGRVKRGDVLVFVGFGAGLTWGANVVRWSRD
jgi:3-oxoacyl-[acyl-carrier-protein] synthase-3